MKLARLPFTKYLAICILVTLLYFFGGKLGLSLAYLNPSASPVWPPTGIALAAFLIFGYRVWPAIFLGAFLVNLATAGTVFTSLGIAAGNTAEGLLGACLVNRYAGGLRAFDRTQTIFRFAVLAAIVSTMVSATGGVAALVAGGLASWADFGTVWLTWWLGDAVGALVVTPVLVLLWMARPFSFFAIGDSRKILEGMALSGGLVLSAWISFGPLASVD
ncbi:MAG: MASE1 domain-containing protein, partial [Acidobacteria bacterium]|nr:MASE1 domain-containing protein [Acidobacteriota bacterium]